MSNKPEMYMVVVYRPEGVSSKELIRYMEDALYMWGGQKNPEHPLFYPWSSGRCEANKLPKIRIRRWRVPVT